MRSRAAPGSGIPLSLVTTRSALARWSIAPVNEVFRPAAKTATKTTSPMPTMSAAAVIAVRAGLRVAFSRASSPVVCPRRSSGQPTSAASGPHGVAGGHRDHDEHEQRAATHRREPAGGRAAAEQAVHEQRDAEEPDHGDRGQPAAARAGRLGRDVLAHRGDGRHARRPHGREQRGGQRHADADDQADDDRARCELHRAARDAHPGRVEQAAEELARTRARRAAPRSMRPRRASRASAPTPARTWPRVAPSERSRANSRRRCATVIEKVLKMMNAPTSSAAPENASSTGVRNAADAVVDLLRRVGGGLLAGLDLEAARQRGPQVAHHPLGRDARRRRGDDARHLALEPVPRLHVGRAARRSSSRRPSRRRRRSRRCRRAARGGCRCGW